MNLFFCDLCNESIPQADLDQGRAVRRGERLICAACEAAMSTGPLHVGAAVTGPGTAALPRVASAHAPSPGSSGVAVALAIASVALVAAVGAGGYLFWRLERDTARLDQDVREVARIAPEQTRSVSAALAEETNQRDNEILALRQELASLGARVQEVAQANESHAGLERRVERLDERMTLLDDLSSRVEHQGGALDKLAASMAAELELAAARAKESAAREREPAAPRAATPPPEPAANAPGGAQWQGWVTDLASANSGTRWQAVQSLGGTGDVAVVPHLLPMLKDGDIFVRMAVCRHLGSLSSIEAIPALLDTLEDEEASVREAALVALRSISGQSIPFDPLARDGDRAKRVRAWRDWWEQAAKEPAKGKTKS